MSRVEYCPTCGATINPYKYTLSASTVSLLRKIWLEVIASKKNRVDVRKADLTYTERSQVTICRFHGLIAKVKDHRGKQVAAHWLITHRGAQFLRGEISIPLKVMVHRNRVVGHGNEVITIAYFRHNTDFGPNWERASQYDIIDGDPVPKIITTPTLGI